ncbi:hypothetical protein HYPSUDRAFT_49365 [Hypholoma sublateritium FD-334 SS-4]|uniref:DUF6699 domain-containing protein n=1 Tax=Hypholoma sublateritium (strain FD-334 SS-4) TaxID=945553 RepID=A0A0D2LTS2_HYPSF|nr:hypothetical protein HYPSUDRAFT_49365 [Hypholoma sublateritium FD-334 SS-4]
MNDISYIQQHPSASPILVPRVPIALPALSPNVPIRTNSLITYRHSLAVADAPLQWDISLPPMVARLAPPQRGNGSLGWAHEPAIDPQSISSIVIRIPRIERPVVVFPETVDDPIMIVDILRAVSAAVRAAAGGADATVEVAGAAAGGSRMRTYSLAVANADAADAVRRHFGRKVYWGGLYDSPSEQDVWILLLYGPRRGGRRVLYQG